MQKNPNEPLPIYTGIVKSVSDRGYAFVECPEAAPVSGDRDIHLHSNEVQYAGLQPGMQVFFILGQNDQQKLTGKVVPVNGIFNGTIKYFDPEKGFGFIECPEAFRLFDTDVFIHQNEIDVSEAKLGAQITFGLKLNDKNQPQALRIHLLEGTIKKRANCVFVQCAAVKEQFEKDAFVVDADSLHYEEGTPVSFRLQISAQNQPQATDVQPLRLSFGRNKAPVVPRVQPQPHVMSRAQPLMPRGAPRAAPSRPQHMSQDVYYEGTVVSVGNKFGFVECAIAKQIYGCDVFVNQTMQTQENLAVGDSVIFLMQLNNNQQPQVTEIKKRGRGLSHGADHQLVKRQRRI